MPPIFLKPSLPFIFTARPKFHFPPIPPNLTLLIPSIFSQISPNFNTSSPLCKFLGFHFVSKAANLGFELSPSRLDCVVAMASGALEEKKAEDEAVVEEKSEAGDDEEKEDLTEKATEEDEETRKKSSRGRKGSSKETETPKKRGGGNSAAKKGKKEEKEKEPVTPVSERPTRERKVVERYSAPESGRSSGTKPLNIEKGSGTQLKDIPNVAFKLSKRKPDDHLQILHTILFGKKAKSHSLKRNIVQFSGFVWADNEQEKQRTRVKEKLDKCVKEKLMDFCDVLNIQVKAGSKKEELSAKLLEFLESPHVTTDVLLAERDQRGQKRKKKVTPSKIAGSGEGSPETPIKKHKGTAGAEKNEKSPKVEEEVDDNDEPSDAKDDPIEEDDEDKINEDTDQGDKSDEEEDEPKDQVSSPKSSSKDVKEGSKIKTGGKSTPAKKTPAKSVKSSDSEKKSRSTLKRSASDADEPSGSKAKGSVKKQKAETESPKDSKAKTTSKKQSSKSPAKVPAKDQVKGKTSKKAKAEPSREDVHAVIVDILKEVDFNTATLSDILKQLGTHFGIDLMHRKAEVKEIITEVINNMTDEEDEEEAEGGDDSDNEDAA